MTSLVGIMKTLGFHWLFICIYIYLYIYYIYDGTYLLSAFIFCSRVPAHTRWLRTTVRTDFRMVSRPGRSFRRPGGITWIPTRMCPGWRRSTSWRMDMWVHDDVRTWDYFPHYWLILLSFWELSSWWHMSTFNWTILFIMEIPTHDKKTASISNLRPSGKVRHLVHNNAYSAYQCFMI